MTRDQIRKREGLHGPIDYRGVLYWISHDRDFCGACMFTTDAPRGIRIHISLRHIRKGASPR